MVLPCLSHNQFFLTKAEHSLILLMYRNLESNKYSAENIAHIFFQTIIHQLIRGKMHSKILKGGEDILGKFSWVGRRA